MRSIKKHLKQDFNKPCYIKTEKSPLGEIINNGGKSL